MMFEKKLVGIRLVNSRYIYIIYRWSLDFLLYFYTFNSDVNDEKFYIGSVIGTHIPMSGHIGIWSSPCWTMENTELMIRFPIQILVYNEGTTPVDTKHMHDP